MSLEEDFERFRQERPLYAQLAHTLEAKAREACRRSGIRCSVTSRAKALDSFAKKLILRPQPYDDVFDKAGVRVLVAYPDDRDTVAKAMRDTFEVSWEKDFVTDLDPTRFEYRGLHLTIGLRADNREDVPAQLWPLVAELQVHRPGEAVWASVGHDLFYKSRLGGDRPARRAMNRLSALLELVDISMAEIRKTLLTGPGADVARIIDAIERDFLRLRGRPFSEPLTLDVVEALRPLVGNVDAFLRAYLVFVETNDAKLVHVFSEYEDDFRHILLSQPESLLIFYLLGVDRPGLDERWPTSVPTKALDALSAVWAP